MGLLKGGALEWATMLRKRQPTFKLFFLSLRFGKFLTTKDAAKCFPSGRVSAVNLKTLKFRTVAADSGWF